MLNQGMSGYRKYTVFIFSFVFLVVLAGGIVRTTHSGMGCPDWPKCFGRWIPPVSSDQLPVDFERYLKKQDIDHSFNAFHTWIEYINRLLGALLGILVLIHLVWTIYKRKLLGTSVLLLSIAMLFVVGFTGWLGKLVVEENLAVVKISTHMVTALLLAFLPLMIINVLDKSTYDIKVEKRIWLPYVLLFSFLIIQLFVGIGVRQEIDVISKAASYVDRDTWLDGVGFRFIIHRSFSWIILLSSIYIYFRIGTDGFKGINKIIVSLVVSLMILGIMLNYLEFPAFAQPLHLLLSLFLITVVFGILHKLYIATRHEST